MKLPRTHPGKHEDLPSELQCLSEKEETYTQNIHKLEIPKSSAKADNRQCPGGLGVEQQPRKLRVAGSNPARGSPPVIEAIKNRQLSTESFLIVQR